MTIRKAYQGSVSLFLAMVLLPIYSCVYFVIDAARYEAAKEKAEGALALCGNGALNDYDFVLKELYGLFAISSGQEEEERLLGNLFGNSVDAYGAGQQNMISTSVKSFSLSFPAEASLARPEVLERYMVDYMKYRAPYQFARGLSQRLAVFRQSAEAATVLEKSQAYYNALSDTDNRLSEIGKTVSGETDGSVAAEKEKIAALQKTIEPLRKALKGTSGEAEEWKSAIEKMEDGELKTLLSGNYQDAAGALSEDGLQVFSDLLQDDLNKLQEYEAQKAQSAEQAEGDAQTEEDDQPFPVLEYPTDPVYRYLLSASNSNASEESKASAKETKAALQGITDTTLSVFYENVAALSVSEQLGSVAATIDALGETGDAPDLSTVEGISLQQLSSIKQLFSDMETALKNQLENCYVEEFLTEQFSCYATGDQAENLSGSVFSESPLFRGELEYILFGKDSLQANVALYTNLLFACRLLFNCIYAFGNAKMRSEALTVATALAGWTGIGITAAQNLLLLLWAGGESVLDVATLCKGGAVPLFKNASTWTLSLNGAGRTLAEGATKYASKQIDDVFALIEQTADDQLEEITGAAENYFRQTAEGAAESVTNLIVTPIEAQLTSLIGNRTAAYAGKSKEQIRQMLQDAVDSVEGNSAAVTLGKQLFTQYCLEELTEEVYQYYDPLLSTEDALSEAAVSALEKALANLYEKLFSAIENEINQKVTEAENQLHQVVSGAKENVKNQTVAVINRYAEQLGSFLGTGSGTTSASVSGSSGLAFSYQDYLKVITFVRLQSNSGKRGMLTRSAKVMQSRVAAKENSFNITQTYTAVRLKAEVRVSSYTIKEEKEYAY